MLTAHFLHKYEVIYSKKTQGLSDLATQALLNYDWPGNVRELENIIERGLILAEEGESINAEYLFPSLHQDNNSQMLSRTGELIDSPPLPSQSGEVSWTQQAIEQLGSMEKIEEALVRYAMSKAENNVAEAARLLDITRPTLAYRLKKLNIEVE